MNMLRENMRLIAECSQKLVRLGENLWGKEQEITSIGEVNIEPLDVPTMTTDFVKEHGLPCPEGYIFKDENGNVINATKIVLEKKKREYPKTYEECCKVMNYCCNPVATKTTHKEELIRKFQFLLLYRDAYWKIAGEEMGLGKPWEPSGNEDCFVISRSCGEVFLFESAGDNEPFEFPTKEMRDAFKENFKSEIESCKELL